LLRVRRTRNRVPFFCFSAPLDPVFFCAQKGTQ
jgi:hypothetical protein